MRNLAVKGRNENISTGYENISTGLQYRQECIQGSQASKTDIWLPYRTC